MNKLIQSFYSFVILFFSTAVSHAALPSMVDGQELPSLAPMVEKVTPAVVNISTEGRVQIQQNPLFNDPFFRRFFNVPNMPAERKTQALGSGVIVDSKRGLILTNNHVIANAVHITVTLRDGRKLEAELVGTDPDTDVAVIKVPPENLTDIKIADSDELRVGDFVVAIGNPFGLGQTVTSGIVSAMQLSGLGIVGYEDFIQTDASINPGNSGGALVNLRGELIGINTAIFSQSGGNIGIGFAIPTNLALNIMEQILEDGTVDRGYLGIQAQDISAELAEAFKLNNQQGAIVNRVIEGSPAEKAGFESGDIITAIDGKTVKNSSDVRNRIGLIPVGEKVIFEVIRNGKTKKLTAQIEVNEELAQIPGSKNERLSGVTVGDIESDSPYYGQLKGVIVHDVERGSPAWRAGLRAGDVVTSVNRMAISDVKEFLKMVDGMHGQLLFRIIRGNSAAFLVIR